MSQGLQRALPRCAGCQALARGVEAYGGIAPHSLAHGRHLARRAKGKYAADRTRYGPHRGSPHSFLTHHVQQISKAAVVYDARAIRKQVCNLKQRVRAGPLRCGTARPSQ